MNAGTRRLAGILIGAALLSPVPRAFGLTPQQERMKECNADANGKALKGADRSAFMKTCLSGKAADQHPAKMTSQQEKMKTCNQEATAKSLKGADRKQFMSTCLSAGH
jgi:hypothetical protein